jgi:hypothetical protein
MSSESSERCATLSAKGMANIIRENYENDFKFIVGEEKYVCPSCVAEFLSPRVSKSRRNDITISEMTIESRDISKCFPKFLSLGVGSSVFFESTDFQFVRSICIELESIELYESIFVTGAEELNEDNVIERLKYGELIGYSCKSEIEFASSHFFSFDQSTVSELSVMQLFTILQNRSLKVKNEDWLYKMISSLISTDVEYSMLLECVTYEHLSRDSIESFFDFISKSFEFLTFHVWRHLRSRLISGPSSPIDHRYHGCVFKYEEGKSFEGIISFLTREHGGNVHDRGIVSVTSSSVNNNHLAKHVVDFDSLLYAQTNNESNGWICYDFKDQRVNVDHYSLRTRNDYDGYHPTNWINEGSIDGREWVEIDRRNDCRDLLGVSRSMTFSTSNTGYFRHIRLRQTGNDSSGYDYLTVSAFELFGILRNS